MAIVLILNFTIAPLGTENLLRFLLGGLLLIVGLSLFLAGTEIGMVPVGEKLGSVLTQKRNIWFMILIGFVIGFAVTLAEPDVSVLAGQVHDLNPGISEGLLTVMIALGVGLFVVIGLLRTVLGLKLRWVLIVFYGLVFLLVAFIGQSMASISFDASGATTGPLAVPFILAMGLGVSGSTKDDQESSFGLTGVASIGPIMAVAIMALTAVSKSAGAVADGQAEVVVETFGSVMLSVLGETAIGFAPLLGIILILQFTLLRFPKVKMKNILFGIVYSFIGIVLFLTGVSYGFTDVGMLLGKTLFHNYSPVIVVLIALVFGGIVVIAEPAVWVLTAQIESVSAGRIKRSLVMIFLCIGVALAVALGILRILLNINFLWFVYIGVGTALLMTFITPGLFTGIAFDSGGVASGPMSTSFLLAFALGVSGTVDMGFGMVGLIAMSPLLSLQVLGMIFRLKERKGKKEAADAVASE
jgi:hypothetical protein